MNNVRWLLQTPTMALPKERDEEDFEAFVKKMLSGFIQDVKALQSTDKMTAMVRDKTAIITDLCRGIEDSIREYQLGHTYVAYERFVAALEPLIPYLTALALPAGLSRLPVMYRMRKGTLQQWNKEDLFHIPFNLRHKVSMKRYSVPGLPTLYLGGSVYVCWEEMGRIPFHEIQIAALWLKKGQSVNLLDFGYRPDFILPVVPEPCPEDEEFQKHITAHIVCWPILASCSIKAKHRGDSFVAEYIIPQFILQWLTSTQNFDGVRYCSTHVNMNSGDPRHICNYVFPPKESPSSGTCPRLWAKFNITQPVSWQLLDAVPTYEALEKRPHEFPFTSYLGANESYCYSAFGQIESKLKAMVEKEDPEAATRIDGF